MIFDTHAHYDDRSFDEDREEILLSLINKNVEKAVNVGADLEGSKSSVELAKAYSFIYAAVGVHPSECLELTENDIDILRRLSDNPKVVAIGEIGLDYHEEEVPRDIQKKWFVRQLELAESVGKPVIIHSRDACLDTLDIMKRHAKGISGVIHCFSYTTETAKEYIDMGFYIGVGGVVTFKNSEKLKNVVRFVPIERILLETDSPYLSPVPYRGKRNDSGNLCYVAEEIAALKGMSVSEVIRITTENAYKFYGLEGN